LTPRRKSYAYSGASRRENAEPYPDVIDNLSSHMGRLIRSVIENWQTTKGEAAFEFLIALVSKRLTLATGDLRIVLQALSEAPVHLTVLIEYASKILL
jgi:hypothetical protein